LGTLRGAEVLQAEGIATATEQMFLLVRFVIEVFGKLLSDANGVHLSDPETWMADRLSESTRSWRNASFNFDGWHPLFVHSQTVLDWDPYREFANLLGMRHSETVFQRAALEASRSPNGPSMGLIVAAAEDFRERRLPAAVHGFHPARGNGHEEAWLSAVFRWFLLRRATADRLAREQLTLVGPIEDPPLQPDEILEQSEENRVADELHEGLDALDTKYADALQRYFGLDGREHALHEIASRYGISHHTARWLVIDALTALSVRLGVQGLLSKEEFAFARLVFEIGMPARVAARQLKLSEQVVRRSIQEKFHTVLRKRTSIKLRQQSVEDSLGTTTDRTEANKSKEAIMNKGQIMIGLRKLKVAPEIQREGGEAYVLLEDGMASLSEIRHVLSEQEDFCDQLVDAGVPLDWVLTHDGARVDVSPRVATIAKEIAQIESREWIAAETVYGACVQVTSGKGIPGYSSPSDELVRRIFVTLEGLSGAFLRTLDAPLRHARPSLSIWQEKDRLYGKWSDGPKDRIDLVPFIQRQVMRFGEFRPDAAAVITSAIALLLSHGELPLPGFETESPQEGAQILRPLGNIRNAAPQTANAAAG
jgi:hypothetical protein